MLHLGILSDALERAVVLASRGRRRAQIFLKPFCSVEAQKENEKGIQELEKWIQLSASDRAVGWRIRGVVQVGQVEEVLPISSETCRLIGANLMAFRSERIQPGVNQEEKEYMARFVLDARDERGVSVLLIEHHMDIITGICDRMLVLSYGEVIDTGIPREVIRNPRVIKAYLGGSRETA